MKRILDILRPHRAFPLMMVFLAACSGGTDQSASQKRLLVPVGVSTHTMDGLPYVGLDGNGIRYDVAFAGYSDDRLVFDVRIENGSGAPVTIGPASFYYLASRDTAWAGTRFPSASKSFGMNPAEERASIDTMMQLEDESLRAAQGTGEYERLRENHDASMANLRRLRSQWDGALEPVTIPPGGRASGRLMFFPRPEFRTVRLHFPYIDSTRSVTFGLIASSM